MWQNFIAATLTPLQNIDEINYWDNRPFSGEWPGSKSDKSIVVKKTIKKKPKRIRTAYTTDQLRALETIFTQNKYITSERRREISKALNIGDKSVKIWFQNRRMKEKKESSESSSDSSTEASVSEMSPPQRVETSLQSSSLLMNTSNQAPQSSPESYQYQAPTFHTNYEQTQASYACDNLMQSNVMQFYTDNNIYPTQYYPNDNQHLNDYNYNQYQQENAMYNNYWCSNNVGSSYFYN